MLFYLEFSQQLYEPWNTEYVAYEPIYEGLYERCESGHWTVKDEQDFESAVRLEAGKVDMFINRKQREIESRISYCERTLSQQNNLSDVAQQSTDDALTDILADVNELGRFTRINFKALESLIQEHDKLTNSNMQHLLVDICRTRPLDNQRFDNILFTVSSLLEICRKRLRVPTVKVSTSDDIKQKSFGASYWVHQDNVTEVKAILLFNLPIYSDDPEQREHPTSAVYLDNDSFTEYSSRLQCDDEAETIDIRWSGDYEAAREVTIERKKYVKTIAGGQSIQEGITINKELVEEFISLSYTAEDYVNDMKLKREFDANHVNQCYTIAQSIQRSIFDKQLQPKVRVFFNRLRFGSSQDQTLSVTLDSSIAFAREGGARSQPKEWRRQDMNIDYPFKNLPQEDLYLFPHAVLETQITDHQAPAWLSRLLDSGLVYVVPRFSTYLHCVAHFWSPKLPLLPWWMSKMQEDIRTSKSESNNSEFSGLSRSNSLKPLIDEQYRMGYLESQLGKKEQARRSSQQSSIINQNDANNFTADSLLAPDNNKDHYVLQQIERVPTDRSSRSLHRFPTNGSSISRTRLRFRYPASDTNSNRNSSFINTYYDGRNNQSQAYMLQDINTVKQDDELRQAAIIEIGEEKKKKKKKGKKNKPRSHTLEPKQYFANERTFIHWLQFAAILLSASLVLLNFGDNISTIAGVIFLALSLVFALYSFGRYRYRAYQMSTRPDVRYDDIYGPAGLCILLLAAMILNFVLRWEHPSSTSTYLGTNNQTGQQNNTQSV